MTGAAFAFEVMDKEWPLWLVIIGFAGLGLVGMLVGKRWPAVSILVLLLIAFGGTRQIAELNDPYVGPAIRAEAGLIYFVLSYLVIAISVVLLAIGVFQGWKQSKSKVNSG